MRTRYFYGWNVVGATFVMALGSFGLGFYGIAVYVAMLQQLHGWSASAVSAPVTVYYVAGALLNGATLGGVLVTPALIYLVGALGFARALAVAALVLVVVLLVMGAAVMRSGPDTLGLGPDGDPPRPPSARPLPAGDRRWRRDALR